MIGGFEGLCDRPGAGLRAIGTSGFCWFVLPGGDKLRACLNCWARTNTSVCRYWWLVGLSPRALECRIMYIMLNLYRGVRLALGLRGSFLGEDMSPGMATRLLGGARHVGDVGHRGDYGAIVGRASRRAGITSAVDLTGLTCIPAAVPAAIPASESSMTRHCWGLMGCDDPLLSRLSAVR